MAGITRSYSITADFATAGDASQAVKKLLKQLDFPQDVIRRVSIAMYEGEINMVIHAGGGEAVVEIEQDKIIIRLKDNGPGIPDIEKAMKEGFSTANDEVRDLGFGAGMGLPNMKKNSDNMDVFSSPDNGTTVIMQIFID